MSSLIDIQVNSFAEAVINGIKDNIKNKKVTEFGSMNASGKMADSLKYSWDGETLKIYSTEKYFTVLETGRKAGKQPPTEAIERWLDDKPVAYRELSKKSLAYLIARKIGREGSLLYRQGGKSGVISDFINQKYIKENLTDKLFNVVSQQIFNEFING